MLDRTALILIIFGQRAHTKEGRLQVELAQVEYDLPRLTRQWSHLSRQKGSVQQRGEGEKQIEVDRRMLRREKEQLLEELEHVRTHRQLHRERRKETGAPVVALVGYTNAGKSTLLNRLASTHSLAEDKLFATLDPMTRRVRNPGGQEILLSDTGWFRPTPAHYAGRGFPCHPRRGGRGRSACACGRCRQPFHAAPDRSGRAGVGRDWRG